MSKCGVVALAGRPNVGKSTLMNALVGEPLSIVSPKPQTTREPVRGLLSEGETQIILLDPAGLFDPAYALQRTMVHAALAALEDADLILYLHPANEGEAPPLGELLNSLAASSGQLSVAPEKVLTVYTKVDLAPSPRSTLHSPPSTFFVSALTGSGLPGLLAAIRARLPEGPFLYDAGDLGTQPVRFFAAEFVREAAFAVLRQELPYSVAVVVDEFREAEEPWYIRATLAVERDSQKPIVLGKGGRTIKAVGTAARRRLEDFLGRRVRLELWVTVWPRWRKDPAVLARLGLPLATEPTR